MNSLIITQDFDFAFTFTFTLQPAFPWQKQDSTRKGFFFSHQHGTKIFCNAENWTFRKCRSEYLKVLQEKGEEYNLTARMQNEAVLCRIKEARKILNTLKWRKSNRIGHILSRVRTTCYQHVFEGKIEGNIRRWRRGKQPLNDFKAIGKRKH